MEILRFEESDAPAPKKKRPSKGLLALGLVAALMGIGTAFASSTISINGNNQVPLSQGVAQVVNCQSDDLTIIPQSHLYVPTPSTEPGEEGYLSPYFYLQELTIQNVKRTCEGKDFKFKIYPPGAETSPIPLTCTELSSFSDVIASVGTAQYKCEDSTIYFKATSAHNYSIRFKTPPDTPLFYAENFGYVTVESTENIIY